jgi:predicted regulator of Ras-like GTPase activity (Roadblock/LC7/MglB family)
MSLPNYLAAESSTAGRGSRLDQALSALLSQTPDLLAASVVSFDGLPMASSLPSGMDEDRVAAMSAALLSLGERAAQGLGRGELSQVYVEGENGSVFLVSAQDEAVLVAVSTKEAKLGLMLFEVKRAAESIGAILQREDEDQAVPHTYDDAAAHTPPGTAVHVPTAPLAEPAPISGTVPAPILDPAADPYVGATPSWT